MPRSRIRFCPHGHDKDASNGSRWSKARTLKGTFTKMRVCKLCNDKHKKNWKVNNK